MTAGAVRNDEASYAAEANRGLAERCRGPPPRSGPFTEHDEAADRAHARRIEVLRLRVKDIQAGHFNILGKGKRGGKWRSNPFDPATMSELNYYFQLRDIEIAKARAKRPDIREPDELLIYERRGELHAYKRSAIDKLIKGVSERTGVACTNHVLRRQFAKELRLSGVPISTISELLGHSDEKTTRLYLGIDMDDKSNAMLQAAKFRAAAEAEKTAEPV